MPRVYLKTAWDVEPEGGELWVRERQFASAGVPTGAISFGPFADRSEAAMFIRMRQTTLSEAMKASREDLLARMNPPEAA